MKEFSLVVDKQFTAEWHGNMDYVAFCPADSKKIAPTQFQWTAKDFTPRDFKVVYYADTSDQRG